MENIQTSWHQLRHNLSPRNSNLNNHIFYEGGMKCERKPFSSRNFISQLNAWSVLQLQMSEKSVSIQRYCKLVFTLFFILIQSNLFLFFQAVMGFDVTNHT